MEKLSAAVDIQEALFDVPHEKLKSLELQKEICAHLSDKDAKIVGLEKKIQECESEMNQAKDANNQRLEKILHIIDRKGLQ